MKLFQKFRYHLPRITHQIGLPIRIGDRKYGVAGYHADRFSFEPDNEPFLLPVLRRVLAERRGAFLDVGANVGQTLFKLLVVDPDRRYVGFEPQLECCFCVEQFLRKNRVAHADVVPIALSDATGMAALFWDQPNDTTASFLPTHAYAPDQQRPHMSWITTRRGDDVIREMGIGELAAIKIDVEGYELEVMTGLAETLATKKPIVIFEVLPNYFWNEHIAEDVGRVKSERANKIHTLLSSAGYEIYQIDSDGNERPIERFDLDTKPRPGLGNDGRDYVARPSR